MYMKKLIFTFALLGAFVSLQARTVDVSAAYTGSKNFDQVQAKATMALTLNTLAGLEAKMANERAFKDPVYSLAVPVSLNFELIRLIVRPFYYLKNKSDDAAFQDAGAFGVETQMHLTLKEDEINDVYTHAFITAAFARQKGTVFFESEPTENRYYSEMAYSLGISQTFFNAFGADVAGTVFQYPDGVSGVVGLRSIMDQQELARTQTLDIVHQLPKYMLSTRFSRMWTDNGSSFYVGYRYGEFHNAESEHSVLVGNSFSVAQRVTVDLAYNHVRDVHNKNKRDIFYIQLETSF